MSSRRARQAKCFWPCIRLDRPGEDVEAREGLAADRRLECLDARIRTPMVVPMHCGSRCYQRLLAGRVRARSFPAVAGTGVDESAAPEGGVM